MLPGYKRLSTDSPTISVSSKHSPFFDCVMSGDPPFTWHFIGLVSSVSSLIMLIYSNYGQQLYFR